MTGLVQLLAYRFPPGASFEGRLIGALERMESGGTLRIVEALFVGRDAEGELSALAVHSRGAGSLVAPLVGFRLDAAERAEVTRAALASEASGPLLRELGDQLEAGEAVAAILVEHVWARAVDAAVASAAGTRVSDVFVAAESLADTRAGLVAALGGRG